MNNNGNSSFEKKQEKEIQKQQKNLEKQNQPHPLRYKKAGVRLTRAEVAEIKANRKKLRADMKAAGITNREDRKILETAKGAYFDHPGIAKPIIWFVSGRIVAVILIILVAALALMFALSEITKMKGHFSVNLTPDLFKRGFSIGESLQEGNVDNPTSYLQGEVAEGAPCISISWIDKNVDQIDGSYNGKGYSAYTFYIQNTGEVPCSFEYTLKINSQSKDVRNAAWVMLFMNGEMCFYAASREDGDNQTLPARDDNTRGYRNPPFMDKAQFPQQQFEIIENEASQLEYYRLIAFPFESDTVVTSGIVEDVQPGDIHKYTVVLWLEGDDPDCTDDLIGGHMGLEFNFDVAE